MARVKKTLEVQELKRWANSILSTPEGEVSHITMEFKDGICTMLEKVLHDANAYNGYIFINPDDTQYLTYGNVSRKYL